VRAVVVDDSIVFRRVVADALTRLGGIEVVASASNGKQAVERVTSLEPDLVTLDIEMPDMDGLAVLEALSRAGSEASVIVLSGLTAQAGSITVRALERGAFDFVAKPVASNPEESTRLLVEALRPRVAALARRREVRAILRAALPEGSRAQPRRVEPSPPEPAPRAAGAAKPELLLIGVSTGGPNALSRLLPALPRDIGVPILIVQLMPPLFTRSLAESLAARCAIGVREASTGDHLAPGTAYIAPGGHHMRVVGGASGGALQITDDPPENNCRPAVDYLFRSAAVQYPGRSLAVILTGMGSDGLAGLRLLKRSGCYVVAQDESSCVVYGMPRAAVEAGVVDAVLPLDEIASRVVARVRGIPS
jgi:two-component system chemotaxis response regulator CheB